MTEAREEEEEVSAGYANASKVQNETRRVRERRVRLRFELT